MKDSAFMQWRLFDYNSGVGHKDNLHNGDQQENLDDLIAVDRQSVIFIDDQTRYKRTKDGTKQGKETIEAGCEPTLVLGNIIGNNGAPRGIRQVIGELQEEEEDDESE